MRTRISLLMLALAAAAGLVRLSADGTETLGVPTITIATGTGVITAGTGMVSGTGTLEFDVPNRATIKQVLLYWQGFSAANDGGDSTIVVDGTPVVGTLIGGPTNFFPGAWASTHRADITSLGLVGRNSNSLSLSGLAFSNASNGAGIIVIIDEGGAPTTIGIRDGSDVAFRDFAPPLLNTTVPQTFTFAATGTARTAKLDLFFASVEGILSGGTRPTTIVLTTNGPGGSTVQLTNLLQSGAGDEFDALTIAANIPANANQLTVQALSGDGNPGVVPLPASLVWLAAAFSIEPTVQLSGRMTGGGSVFTIDDVRVTRGFQIHCDLREPNNLEVNWPGGNNFHLTGLTSAACTDNLAIIQAPPKSAPFDTFTATGVGKLNNVPGARIEFVFVDAGEPGTSDTATIKIYDSNDTLVLDVPGDPSVPGFLDRGNVQAHKDNQ